MDSNPPVHTSSDATTNVSDLVPVGKPDWLKTKIPSGSTYMKIRSDLKDRGLFTVCQEAKCPNIGECWNSNTATFMVLGGTCTRGCRFCNVATGNPEGKIDRTEPGNVAESARIMGLRYVVITMVDRDDLVDGGANHVADVVNAVRLASPEIKIELLAGDFNGRDSALEIILKTRPEVFAHNLETVRTLTPRVRDRRASYTQSLQVLRRVKELAGYKVLTKSALMLGLGETFEQTVETMQDMRAYGVDFITIGQYMRPTKKHLSIKRWVHPDEFKQLELEAIRLGFRSVASGPLIRSSYRAREFYNRATDTP